MPSSYMQKNILQIEHEEHDVLLVLVKPQQNVIMAAVTFLDTVMSDAVVQQQQHISPPSSIAVPSPILPPTLNALPVEAPKSLFILLAEVFQEMQTKLKGPPLRSAAFM